MENFDFYPHTCRISRGETLDPETGIATDRVIYQGKCYLQQGRTSLRGEWLQGEDSVLLDNSEINIMTDDRIEVTLENGSIYKAIIKQAYPIEDEDFGGQDLKLYQRDGVDSGNEPA